MKRAVSRSVSWLEIFPRHKQGMRVWPAVWPQAHNLPVWDSDTAKDSACGLTPHPKPADRQRWLPALPRPVLRSLLSKACWIHSETYFYCQHLVTRLWRGNEPTSDLKRQPISTQAPNSREDLLTPHCWALVQCLTILHHHRPPKSKPLLLATQRVWGKSHNPSHRAL